MRMHTLSFLLGTCLAAALPGRADEGQDGVVAPPLSMTTQVDAGQIVKGHVNDLKVEDQFLQRTSVWLTQQLIIDKNLEVKAGVGGVFWYALPGGEIAGDAAHKNLTRFGPGISQVEATYSFGDAEKPTASLQMGLFPYKYNPDAMDLGEYLLRSGAYPNYLATGGWNIVSKAAYMMQGLRFNLPLWDGKFRTDFLLPMERDFAPMGDISPTFVTAVDPIPGIEIGGGADCHHCIPIKPSRTSPEHTFNPNDASGNPGNAYVVPNPDPATQATQPYIRDTTRFYTFMGVKVMGRMSIDPKAWFGMNDLLGADDLKLFGEVAVLGWKNYPFYYEKRSERMPVMFGFNAPTFHLLDILSFQMEYFGSKFPNSEYDLYYFQLPIVSGVDSTGVQKQDPNSFDLKNTLVRRDDWKWALYARRTITPGIRVYAQVANDHLRVPSFNLQPSWTQVTDRNGKDWYFLARLEMGI